MPDDPATPPRPDQPRADERSDDEHADADPGGTDRDAIDGNETHPEGADSDDHDATTGTDTSSGDDAPEPDPNAASERSPADAANSDVPPDVREYARFSKVDGARYERVNEFLRERTYVTAREWAIARLCADFRTETGVEMTKIGENLPELVPFMTDTYTPQAVNQARSAFEGKVRKAGATFLYGAMSDFFTADDLDEVMYETTEVAKFLLEVEGVDLGVEEELDAEERISSTMREVRAKSAALRHDEVACPHCGHEFDPDEVAGGDGADANSTGSDDAAEESDADASTEG